MPEELINATIKFDAGIGGAPSGAAAGGLGGAAGASGQTNQGLARTMGLSVTLPITDVLHDISKGIGLIAQASPILNAELIRLRKGMQLVLMPIGRIMAESLRPFTNAWLKSARKFYDDYQSGGLMSAFAGAIGEFFTEIGWIGEDGKISFTGIIENLDEIVNLSATLTVGLAGAVAGVGLLKWLFGAGAAGAGVGIGVAGLLFTAAVAITSFKVSEALGYSNLTAGLMAMFGGLGAYLITAGAAGIGIPIVLAAILLPPAVKETQEWINSFVEGTVGAETFDEALAERLKGKISSAFQRVRSYFTGTGQGTELLDLGGGEYALGLGEEARTGASIFFEDLANAVLKVTSLIIPGMGAVGTAQSLLGGIQEVEQTSEEKITLMSGQMLSYGEEVDKEITKVNNLNQEVVKLPNINRTITYHIKYVEG